jgi:hypothetical protein
VKVTGIILIVVGVLLGVAGFAAPVVGAGAALSAVNTTDSTTFAEGTLPRLLNPAKLLANPADPYDTDVEFRQTRVTQADSEAMEQSDAKDAGATIFTTTATTVRTDTGAELSKAGAVYAFDPSNSELINCCGATLVGFDDDGNPVDVNVDFSGQMPLKFPFDSPQADVQYWSDALQAPTTAKYMGEVEEYGMTLYRYVMTIEPTQTPAEPLAIPVALARNAVTAIAPDLADQVPAEGNLELFEWYSAENEFFVEPLTGQIVNGTVNDKTTFRLDGGSQDLLVKVETLGGSAEVEEGAADIKASADQLKTVAMATPVLIGLGLVLLVVGIILLVLAGKKKKAAVTA